MFCSAFLVFLDVFAKDYFYAGDVLLFELIFPCHRKCFGLWVGSLVIFTTAVAEKNRTSSPSQVYLVSEAFFFIGVCFEIPLKPLSIRLPPLRRRYCEVFWELFHPFSIPTILACKSLVLFNFLCCGSRKNYASDSFIYLFRLVDIYSLDACLFSLRFCWFAELVLFMFSPLQLSNHLLTQGLSLTSSDASADLFLSPTPL